MKLIVAGDSWTYGSEIRDPRLPTTVMDWDPKNDHYRTAMIWPTIVGRLLGAEDVVNLSYPASSNDRIIRVTKNWLIKNYLQPNKPTDDLFLIIGFTSPERKDFYYKDENASSWITIWPMWNHEYLQKPLLEFHKLYVRYMWNPEEYAHRYVNQVLDMQNFCQVYGIKHLFFQAFYQHKDIMPVDWKDLKIHERSPTQEDRLAWTLVDPINFMNKNQMQHSFHNYIVSKDQKQGTNIAFTGQHPSEIAHQWWSEHIVDYCKENNLW